MKIRNRISLLFFIGIFIVGSTALGYYYYFVYEPPISAANRFMEHMQQGNEAALHSDVIVSTDIDEGKLREATGPELKNLLSEPFQRGRILDERKHEGKTRNMYYLVYREPDGRVFALIAMEFGGRYRIVIPEAPGGQRRPYLWDYSWTN